MKISISQSHFDLARLLARQAVRDHLTQKTTVPCAMGGKRSNRPVQSAGNNK